jgi:hypothetical protein
VKNTARRPKIAVSADGSGIISQAGSVLLIRTLQVTGLDRQLSAGLQRWRAPRAVHDPGKIIADLAAAVALGGDCLADIAMLRAEPGLSGPVASDPVVSRLIAQLAADAPRALKAIRGARAAARERAWALAGDAAPGADGGLVTVDIDATVVTAHSEKIQAAPTWKKTFGFHPLTAFADHGPDGSGEPLAIMLRPGNAGSNTAADHIETARLAAPTTSSPGWHSRDAGCAIRSGSPSPRTSPPRSARFPPRRGRRPTTPEARSGRVPGSPRSPACWTCRPGLRGCG